MCVCWVADAVCVKFLFPQVFRELLESCRLFQDNADVQFYIVNDITHLSRTHHHAY